MRLFFSFLWILALKHSATLPLFEAFIHCQIFFSMFVVLSFKPQVTQTRRYFDVTTRSVQGQVVTFPLDREKMIPSLVKEPIAVEDTSFSVIFHLLIVQVMTFLWLLC